MHIARGRDVNARDDCGMTLLSLAVSRGHFGTTKLLLEAGADPVLSDVKNRNPLEIARANGFLEIVAILSAVVKLPAAKPSCQ